MKQVPPSRGLLRQRFCTAQRSVDSNLGGKSRRGGLKIVKAGEKDDLDLLLKGGGKSHMRPHKRKGKKRLGGH